MSLKAFVSSLFLSFALLSSGSLQAEPIKTEKAVLGAGCFWCVEAIFQEVSGVIAVVSGFAGGTVANPTYEQVCTEKTGHAEVVEIEFDPQKISYEKLLEVFWKTHDITDGRGVAPDFGPSYRPIILYANEAQKATAFKSKQEIQKTVKKPIGAEIVPLKVFYPAEDYHQDYVKNNPNQPYVKAVSIPKLKKLGFSTPK
ncbi:MAG: peptide-methionine (S)-S-oxide reductase MsrA [Blastochloris sp.]|nr:peptide-methionine (S)-S-oxide reductase MsrA [Blastochloris sp.]